MTGQVGLFACLTAACLTIAVRQPARTDVVPDGARGEGVAILPPVLPVFATLDEGTEHVAAATPLPVEASGADLLASVYPSLRNVPRIGGRAWSILRNCSP
jgi:hypothetical protein